MNNKIIVPIKEYPTWIDCHVFKKESTGEYSFLYREPYQKDYINIETLKKLLRYDRTVERLEKYMNVLELLELPEETKRFITTIYEDLTKDDVIDYE